MTRRVLFGWFAAAAIACFAAQALAQGTPPAPPPANPAGVVLKEAFDLYNAGNYPAASAKFEQGLRMNPDRPQAAVGFFLLGETYAKMNEGFKAKANYEASLQADPNSQVAGDARERLRAMAAGPTPGGPAAPPALPPSGTASTLPPLPPGTAPPPPPGSPPPLLGRPPGPAQAPAPPPRPAPPPGAPASPPPSVAMAPAFDILRPGTQFRDCDFCPLMVTLPLGQFRMGSEGGGGDEKPVRIVAFRRPFAAGKFEVTFQEWDVCVAQGGCRSHVSDRGWGRGNRPVIHVTWTDAKDYVTWLSRVTGKQYRLLTESEWEFAARGGSPADDVSGRGVANCKDCGSPFGGRGTAPVGSFPPNPYGLHDILGNVWEWTEDCWNENYRGAPVDGSPWLSGDCSRRSLRGGGWDNGPSSSRAANRNKDPITDRDPDNGFRVARNLP